MNPTGQSVTIKRTCTATQIPSGVQVTLMPGMEVGITQALGGSYTLATPRGLVRLDAADADALGLEIAPDTSTPPEETTHTGPVNEQLVWERLKTVYDPEIPVNIVDLGLVYSMEIYPKPEGGNRVEVKMTLTAPGCGMGPTIQADAKQKVLTVPGVTEAEVELVWDPPWTQGMISEVGRMKLGMI
ncbi:MAG: putative Fe-S cluster assembly protein SufT [Candidatus Methylacidiphilales bacterium]